MSSLVVVVVVVSSSGLERLRFGAIVFVARSERGWIDIDEGIDSIDGEARLMKDYRILQIFFDFHVKDPVMLLAEDVEVVVAFVVVGVSLGFVATPCSGCCPAAWLVPQAHLTFKIYALHMPTLPYSSRVSIFILQY